MANNISVLDSNSVARTVKTTDTSDVHTPHHNVDTIAAGASDDIGATTDSEATGNGSIIAILKRLRTLLSGGLPSALTASGNLKTSIAESTATVTVDGTVTAAQTTHDSLNANANIQVGDADVGNSNPVPVSDAGGTLTVDGTVTANAGTGTFGVSGTVAVSSGSVDIHGALPAGTNALGSVTVTSGSVDVTAASVVMTSGSVIVTSGSVDITGGSVEITGALPTGANTIGAVNAGTGAFGAKLQDGAGTALTSTTVSTDQALDVNVVQSAAVTVSGTVTANAGTGTFTTAGTISSGSIDIHGALPAGTNSIGKVEVTSGSMDITAASVVVTSGSMILTAALPAGTNSIGKVEVSSGSVDITGGSVQITGALPAGTNAIGTVAVTSGSIDTILPAGANATQVQGTAASGTSAVGNPVLVAGQDSGSTVRAMLVDSAGHLQVDVITGSTSIDDGGNTITVDGTVTANAGTGTFAVSGSVDIQGALPAGTNNIGDVDIASGSVDVIAPVGTAAFQVQGTAASGAAAVGYPVLIAGQSAGSTVYALLADSSGHLQVDVISGTTTVSGSVDIQGALPAGTNNIGDVDIASGSVDIQGALPAGTNNIGDVDIASGSVDIIAPVAANAIHIQGTTAHDASASGNPVQVGGVAESTRTTAVSDGDAVRAWFDTLGRQVVQVGSAEPNYTAAEYTSEQTNTSLVAGSAGLRITIYDILVSTAGSARVLFEESDGTTRVFGRVSLADKGGWSFNSAKGVALTAGCGLVVTTACCGSSPLSVTVNWAAVPSL